MIDYGVGEKRKKGKVCLVGGVIRNSTEFMNHSSFRSP